MCDVAAMARPQSPADGGYAFSSAAFRKKKKKAKKIRTKKLITAEEAASKKGSEETVSKKVSKPRSRSLSDLNRSPQEQQQQPRRAGRRPSAPKGVPAVVAPPISITTPKITNRASSSTQIRKEPEKPKIQTKSRGQRELELELELTPSGHNRDVKKPWETDICKKNKSERGERLLRDGPSNTDRITSTRAANHHMNFRRARSLSTTRHRSLSSRRYRSPSVHRASIFCEWDISDDEQSIGLDDATRSKHDDEDQTYEKYRQFLASSKTTIDDDNMSRQSVLSLKQRLGAAPSLELNYRYSAAADELLNDDYDADFDVKDDDKYTSIEDKEDSKSNTEEMTNPSESEDPLMDDETERLWEHPAFLGASSNDIDPNIDSDDEEEKQPVFLGAVNNDDNASTDTQKERSCSKDEKSSSTEEKVKSRQSFLSQQNRLFSTEIDGSNNSRDGSEGTNGSERTRALRKRMADLLEIKNNIRVRSSTQVKQPQKNDNASISSKELYKDEDSSSSLMNEKGVSSPPMQISVPQSPRLSSQETQEKDEVFDKEETSTFEEKDVFDIIWKQDGAEEIQSAHKTSPTDSVEVQTFEDASHGNKDQEPSSLLINEKGKSPMTSPLSVQQLPPLSSEETQEEDEVFDKEDATDATQLPAFEEKDASGIIWKQDGAEETNSAYKTSPTDSVEVQAQEDVSHSDKTEEQQPDQKDENDDEKNSVFRVQDFENSEIPPLLNRCPAQSVDEDDLQTEIPPLRSLSPTRNVDSGDCDTSVPPLRSRSPARSVDSDDDKPMEGSRRRSLNPMERDHSHQQSSNGESDISPTLQQDDPVSVTSVAESPSELPDNLSSNSATSPSRAQSPAPSLDSEDFDYLPRPTLDEESSFVSARSLFGEAESPQNYDYAHNLAPILGSVSEADPIQGLSEREDSDHADADGSAKELTNLLGDEFVYEDSLLDEDPDYPEEDRNYLSLLYDIYMN